MLRSLLALLLLAGPVLADDTNKVTNTQTLLAATVLAASGNATRTVDIDRGDVFGLSWSNTTTGTASLALTMRYANDEADTHSIPVSQDGTTYTTSYTASGAAGLTDLVVPPARSFRLSVTNSGAVPATVTIRLFRQ